MQLSNLGKCGSKINLYLTMNVSHCSTTSFCPCYMPVCLKHLSTNHGQIIKDIFNVLSENHGHREMVCNQAICIDFLKE